MTDVCSKDQLWKNFRVMQQRFGKAAFGFHPDTFSLPTEYKALARRLVTLMDHRHTQLLPG